MSRPTTKYQVPDRVGSIDRSKIRYMFDLAQQYDEESLVHLEIGEPDFNTPQHIIEEAYNTASEGATHYTSNAGLPELRNAIADWNQSNRDISPNPDDEIIVTTGAMEALYLALSVTVGPGEEVLVPEPGWPNYTAQITSIGGEKVSIPLNEEDGFGLSVETIDTQISKNTSAIILTRPSNPTGRVYSSEQIEEIAEIAADNDAYIIADEVYSELEYDTDVASIASLTPHTDRVLTVDSVSKKYAMTGWRVGWLIGPAPLISHAEKLHESIAACAPTPSQHAAVQALNEGSNDLDRMADQYRKRRDMIVDYIEKSSCLHCPRPEGAFYAFVNLEEVPMSSMDAAEELLKEHGVVVAPGSGFGSAGENYVRISYAADEDTIMTGLEKVELFAREYQS